MSHTLNDTNLKERVHPRMDRTAITGPPKKESIKKEPVSLQAEAEALQNNKNKDRRDRVKPINE